MFSMVVVGGLGSIGGAILGAVVRQGLAVLPHPTRVGDPVDRRRPVADPDADAGRARRRGRRRCRDGILRWYARRKGIRVPSLLADTRVDVAPEMPEPDLAEALAEAAENADALAEIHE